MDTGQGDEARFDAASRKMVPNTSDAVTRGRAEGVIQFVSGRTRAKESILGIHLAVNKTAVGEYQGCDVPYLPEDLEKNLTRMIRWSETYYPIQEPVRAEAESYLHEQRADEVGALIPLIYPVFRDPARRDGQPVSREIIMDYWHTLCAAVEDWINTDCEDERRIVLTQTVNGKRKAIYDIHSMRVTGVTNMLKRGMPPDLVQQVVGHACLVMTMYYRDIRMSEMQIKLRDYHESRQANRDRLKQLPLPELGEHLFNVLSDDLIEDITASNGTYQKAWGPSWKILAHGICPGGDCGDGGELRNGSNLAVRPTACPVCRHRLTGPAFLPGLVANANLLLYQMRREAEALRDLQERKYELEDEGRSTAAINGELQQVRLRFEDYALEWAAEVQYVHKALAMDASDEGDGSGMALVSVRPTQTVLARMETHQHEFPLLQAIASASSIMTWKPPAAARAILEHSEFLDQVLDANGIGPLMLRLPKAVRKRSVGATFPLLC